MCLKNISDVIVCYAYTNSLTYIVLCAVISVMYYKIYHKSFFYRAYFLKTKSIFISFGSHVALSYPFSKMAFR